MDKLGFGLMGFVGVVEDRKDPQQLGRVRVRCFGAHTEELCNDEDGQGTNASGQKRCIDTAQLPWAIAVQPNTQGSMNGIGTSPNGLVEGTWVFGVFIDGQAAQQPIVLGSIPGIPECANPLGDPDVRPDECDILSLQDQGFYDPRKDTDLEDAPKVPKKIRYKQANPDISNTTKNDFTGYKSQSHNPSQKESDDEDLQNGVGEVAVWIDENDSAENYPLEGNNENEYRKGTFKLEPDINRLARTECDDSKEEEKRDKTLIKFKKDNLDKDVPTAEMPDITQRIPAKCNFRVGPGFNQFRDSSDGEIKSGGTMWEEPPTPYDAQYPYNKVMETESGHVEEWDDTPGAERYHRFHRAGTFKEIHPDGTVVEKIVGEAYEIVLVNKKTHVEANFDLTVDKAMKLFVNADGQQGNHLDIQVGDGSDVNVYSGGNINVYAKNDLTLNSARNLLINVDQDVIWRIGGDIDMHVGGDVDTTIRGKEDRSIVGNKTELIEGGFTQEIQGGGYVQRILGTSYVISGGLMTEIGLGDITMNPLNRPSSVEFTINPEPRCFDV